MHQLARLSSLQETTDEQEKFFFSLSSVFAHATISTKDGREERVVVGDWTPLLYISESDGEYLVEAELTVDGTEGLGVVVANGVLTISGELNLGKYPRLGCDYGRFSRSILLPDGVEAGKVNAELVDGLLQVHLPKKQAAERGAIEG